MAFGWGPCDTCRRVLPIDDYPSPDLEATTCSACLAPKPAKRRRTTSTVTTRRTATGTAAAAKRPPAEPAPPPEPVPLRAMIGRGDPAARRARARAIALEDLTEEHAGEYRDLLSAAAEERRGPGRARTEL